MRENISIIGAGNWGTTLAIILSKKGINVTLHSVFKDHNAAMKKERENKTFLKGVKFPTSLNITSSLKQTLQNQRIIIAIPVKFIRRVLKKINKQNINFNEKIFVSVSKGIESKSLKRVSQIIEEELKIKNIGILSGPNIAREVLEGIPSASVLVYKKKTVGKRLQILLSTSVFRVYLHNDIVGVEIGAALKNVIALACGISDGLGFGTNTKAALVTRGLVEIMRLGKKMGANPLTFWGISGLGDMTTTCFSPYSRNRQVGEKIGRGKKISVITKNMQMVAEGVETVKSAYKLSKELKVDMPITSEVYSVLYKGKSPQKAVSDLMRRPLKEEKISRC